MLAGQHFSTTYQGRYYGKSQHLMRRVGDAYDRALRDEAKRATLQLERDRSLAPRF